MCKMSGGTGAYPDAFAPAAVGKPAPSLRSTPQTLPSPILLARHNGPLVATTLLTEVEAHRVECSDCC